MGNWNHTYDPASVGPQDTITDHTPGAKIGAAITEIQEKCATSAELVPGAGLQGDAEIVDNHLTVRVSLDKTSPESGGDGDGLPAGGKQYQVLQRDSNGNAVWDWVRIHG